MLHIYVMDGIKVILKIHLVNSSYVNYLKCSDLSVCPKENVPVDCLPKIPIFLQSVVLNTIFSQVANHFSSEAE